MEERVEILQSLTTEDLSAYLEPPAAPSSATQSSTGSTPTPRRSKKLARKDSSRQMACPRVQEPSSVTVKEPSSETQASTRPAPASRSPKASSNNTSLLQEACPIVRAMFSVQQAPATLSQDARQILHLRQPLRAVVHAIQAPFREGIGVTQPNKPRKQYSTVPSAFPGDILHNDITQQEAETFIPSIMLPPESFSVYEMKPNEVRLHNLPVDLEGELEHLGADTGIFPVTLDNNEKITFNIAGPPHLRAGPFSRY